MFGGSSGPGFTELDDILEDDRFEIGDARSETECAMGGQDVYGSISLPVNQYGTFFLPQEERLWVAEARGDGFAAGGAAGG